MKSKSIPRALVVLVLAGGSALAQPLDDPNIKKADQLFAEGKALLDSNLIEACSKFDASLKLNPSAIGTLVNIALCDEKLGKYASAAKYFNDVRDTAKEQGLPQHLKLAEDHLATVEPLVPHVAIQLTETLPGTKVLIDDKVILARDLGDVTIDPGEHHVVVTAPERLPYRGKLVIAKSQHKGILIPALSQAIIVHSSRRRLGQITALVGAVAAGTGLGLGLYANHLYHQQFDGANPACTDDPKGKRCTDDGLTQTHRAHTLGNVGTIVGIAGVATAGVGIYLWLTAPRDTVVESKPVAVAPAITPDSIGVVAVGQF